jgi:Fungal Zn(2)-Cys(6) binuclear cluster domain.
MSLHSNGSAVRPEPIDVSSWEPPYRHEATDASHSEGSSGDAAKVTSNKRHLLDSVARYPRKRGATACQICRIRKTKCDNARPACGFCVQHKARCVYGSSSEASLPFDAASEEILSRLSAIQSLLSHGHPVLPTAAASYDQTYPIAGVRRGVDLKIASASTSASHMLWRQGYPASALSATRCETLLQWPVFEDVVSVRESNIKSFLLDCTSDRSGMVDLAASGQQQLQPPSRRMPQRTSQRSTRFMGPITSIYATHSSPLYIGGTRFSMETD